MAAVMDVVVLVEGRGVHADWRLVRVGGRLRAESRSRLYAGDAWRVRAEFPEPARPVVEAVAS